VKALKKAVIHLESGNRNGFNDETNRAYLITEVEHTGLAWTELPEDVSASERVLDALGRAPGVRLLLILSGNDLTAQAFLQLASSSRAWRRLMASRRLTYHHLAEANHTFATAEWRRQVEQWTVDWVKGR